MKTILIVGSLPSSLINFRGELIRKLSKKNNVICIASQASPQEKKSIESLGCKYLDVQNQRNRMNPLEDIKYLFKLCKVLKNINPDVTVAYTIKPVIWVGISSRIIGNNSFFPMITGLGYAFQKGGFLKKLLNMLVIFLYKIALKKCRKVFFQNVDNMNLFINTNLIERQKCVLVNGSGVDLNRFKYTEISNHCDFLMIARLLIDKGVKEYAEAAKIVKKFYPQTNFTLIGPEDMSPNSFPIEEINRFVDEGRINYLGPKKDVLPFIQKCSVFVLPSYHEGMPRTSLEAMSVGRPILTTDVPGCRETVNPGVNGWLVNKGSVNELAEKMIWFIENPKKIKIFGKESYLIAKEKFDVEKVNKYIINTLNI